MIKIKHSGEKKENVSILCKYISGDKFNGPLELEINLENARIFADKDRMLGDNAGFLFLQAIFYNVDTKVSYPIDSWILFNGLGEVSDTFSYIITTIEERTPTDKTQLKYKITFTKTPAPLFLWIVSAEQINPGDKAASSHTPLTQTNVDIEIGPKVN